MQCWASWRENSGDLLLPAALHEPVQPRAASLPLARAEPSWEIAGSCRRVRARPVSPSAATGSGLEVGPAWQHLAGWSAWSCALGALLHSCSKAEAKQLYRSQYGRSGTLRKGTGTEVVFSHVQWPVTLCPVPAQVLLSSLKALVLPGCTGSWLIVAMGEGSPFSYEIKWP